MKRSLKKTLIAGLASAALAASIVGVTSTSASAITGPDFCPNEPEGQHSEFLEVEWQTTQNPGEWDCFANGGEYDFGQTVSVNEISTGNNSVQYFTNGSWQPAQPIGHNQDVPYWGNPLQITKIRIV